MLIQTRSEAKQPHIFTEREKNDTFYIFMDSSYLSSGVTA